MTMLPRQSGLILERLDLAETQMVDRFARVFQVTESDARKCLIRMATVFLEAEGADGDAHRFARMLTDDLKRGYDLVLAALPPVPARKKAG